MLFLSILMQTKSLHIISFENPFPPDFGGVIDVFYKIKALHTIGFKIYLHCFYQTRSQVSAELKAITEEVFLYKKNRNPFFLFSKFPLPVVCRFHKDLIQNIAKIDAPVFFEGLQTTMILQKINLPNKKYLRLHNIESDFYAGMSKNETNYFWKVMYHLVAEKFINYQKIIPTFNHVFTLSCYENEVVKSMMKQTNYISVFHGNQHHFLSERGKFALYHGDLRLADNKNAAKFLIEVFKEIPDYKLIIASSTGKKMIEDKAKNLPNVTFVELNSNNQLTDLFAEAHINVMLSFQRSGTKLKVVNSLFNGRFCLVNKNMIDDVDILILCELAETKQEFIAKINELKNKDYQENERRNKVLSVALNDIENAKKIEKLLLH